MQPPDSATVEHISIYPIKSLDGRPVERVEIVTNGGLAGDREYALFDEDGDYVNGKNDQQVHPIRATYDGETARAAAVTLSTPAQEPRQFELGAVDSDETAALADWLREWFGYPVTLDRNREGGFPDDTTASGPTIISKATINTVADWFDGIDAAGMRRRLRPNIVVSGVPAFWEDHLFAERDSRVQFSIGEADFFGVNPCQRCVVPSRDPDTGDEIEDFNKTFIEKRRTTMPDWSGGDWFNHDFRLMVNTAVPETSWGETIAVGDELTVGETVTADDTPVPAE
ncbi:MOSC domain-containing protein [Halonotius terrestris]|uniref:MOSC domain-containing protein n=1 Tax=Halonotius terrestris TaxID=2487750 RepID=A0A8J8PA80_9EURY|nr:MOSC N-terminal beta barrel domain-containing protein [Halonotius terrestris]TQQ82746.1 MOSC domain-containing protein [Halonotius terrestris]